MTNTKNYPFPHGDDDELLKRFNIALRVYSDEQLEAAATSWTEFCSGRLDSTVFVKLVAVCEGSLAEATVLWDALLTHRNWSLKYWQETAATQYVKKYGTTFGSRQRYSEALEQLGKAELLVHWPVSANVPRKFRLDWIELSERLAEVSNKLPGLVSYSPVEVV